MSVKVEVAKTGFLNGTIDPHDPIYATFQITGPQGSFRNTVFSVNWGRGYKPGEFKSNVDNVLDHVDSRAHFVLLIQELDEADAAPEHKITRKELATAVGPGSHLIEWWNREPIIVSKAASVSRERKVMTMDQGTAIGAPKGTGPRRFFVSGIVEIMGVKIGVGNTHPHRGNTNSRAVEVARKQGEQIVTKEVRKLVRRTDLTIWGGDMNDRNYPKMHPKEKTAFERGFDTIRYIVA